MDTHYTRRDGDDEGIFLPSRGKYA